MLVRHHVDHAQHGQQLQPPPHLRLRLASAREQTQPRRLQEDLQRGEPLGNVHARSTRRPIDLQQAEQRELAEAERRLREEKRKVDSEARQSLQDRTSGADPGAA